MNTLLKKLYYGYNPLQMEYYSQDSEYVAAAQRKEKAYTKLMATFDESQKDLWERYMENEDEMSEIRNYDFFKRTLKFGITLMIEILLDVEEEYDTK